MENFELTISKKAWIREIASYWWNTHGPLRYTENFCQEHKRYKNILHREAIAAYYRTFLGINKYPWYTLSTRMEYKKIK